MDLGRGEMRAGRSLDALLAAYRLGARVAWRRLAAAGERAGLDPRTLYTLAEAIFAYIDELSADSIEGYAREQAAAAGALHRRRQRLAALLVQDPPAAPATVEAAAANAAWRLPRRLAALVVEAEEEHTEGGAAPGEQADRLGRAPRPRGAGRPRGALHRRARARARRPGATSSVGVSRPSRRARATGVRGRRRR